MKEFKDYQKNKKFFKKIKKKLHRNNGRIQKI